jgi:hypothetical protein
MPAALATGFSELAAVASSIKDGSGLRLKSEDTP